MPTLFGRNNEKRDHTFSPEHYHKNYIFMNDKEKAAFQETKDILESGSQEEKLKFSHEKLGKYGPGEIFKLAENYPAFEELCQHDDYPHVEEWSKRLKEKDYLYFELVSLDGENVCTIYDHLVNTYIRMKLEIEAQKPKEDINQNAWAFWINEGCKYNSYKALTFRAEDEIAKIKEIYFSVDKPEPVVIPEPDHNTLMAWKYFPEIMEQVEAIKITPPPPTIIPINLFKKSEERAAKLDEADKNLEETLDVISNLYMTVGHMYAAREYYDLATSFAEDDTEESQALAIKYYIKGAEKFFAGKYLLEMHKENAEQKSDYKHLNDDAAMIGIMTGGKGLSILGYNSIEEAQKKIVSALPSKDNQFEIQKNARKKIDIGLDARERKMNDIPKPRVGR